MVLEPEPALLGPDDEVVDGETEQEAREAANVGLKVGERIGLHLLQEPGLRESRKLRLWMYLGIYIHLIGADLIWVSCGNMMKM